MGPAHPAPFFGAWLTQAFVHDPQAHAMSLATATRDRQPSVRTVLLKAFGRDGFVFFTSGSTLKVQQIAENPRVALLFFWPELRRQVRIQGSAARVPRSTLARGLLSGRPGSRALTWVSPDGRLADAREALAAGIGDTYSFLVAPHSVRFWQGGTDRRHASLDFERANDDWTSRASGPADLLVALGLSSLAPQGAPS